MTDQRFSDDSLHTVPTVFHAQADRYADRAAIREKVLGIWEEITGRSVKVEVIKSILKGDDVCSILIIIIDP